MPTPNKILTNKRILITRTRHQASELAAQLEALGATPIVIPTIEIVPPSSFAALDAALKPDRNVGCRWSEQARLGAPVSLPWLDR